MNAASGTWPPFGKAAEEAAGPPPNALFEALADEIAPGAEDERLAVAAVEELDGPNNWFPAVPPETKPEELEVAPVRMKRSRRLNGFF